MIHTFNFFLSCALRHLENERFLAETQILRRYEAVEKDIDAFSNGEGHSDDAISTGNTVQATNEVGQIVENGQIMLDNDNELVRMNERPDSHGSVQTLLDVQIG